LGLFGFPGDPGGDPREKFKDCLNKYGDDRAKKNLTYDSFMAAGQAAATAQIATSELLALWDNENSLKPDMMIGRKGPAGEIGAMQITPPAVGDLSRFAAPYRLEDELASQLDSRCALLRRHVR